MKVIKSFMLAFTCFACFLITNQVNAATLERDVPESEYLQLYSIENSNADLVQVTSDYAVFSTNNYMDGFFDRYSSYILSNNLPSNVYDNNISSNNGHLFDNYSNFTLELTKPVDVTGYYYRMNGTYPKSIIVIYLYDENNNSLGALQLQNTASSNEEFYKNVNAKNVKKMIFRFNINGDSSSARKTLMEFDFFIDPASLYESIYNFSTSNITENSIDVFWDNPESENLIKNKLYLNDKLLYESDNLINNYSIKELESDTNYKITVAAVYADAVEVKRDFNFKTNKDITAPGNIKNLSLLQDKKSVLLSWETPNDKDFSHVKVYKNNTLFLDNVTVTNLTDTGVNYNDNYTYKITTVDTNGNESNGIIKTITLIEPPKEIEVKDLRAKAKDYSEVELSWKNPNDEEFETVTIYRKSQESGIMARVLSFFSTDEYTPIFQTNGTLFKDLTVAPETTYEYKVTSLVAGVESEGVTTQVTTPQIAVINPEIIKEDPSDPTNQNFLFRWEKPTQGSIKILIDGKEFATVNAAAKQQLIPADKMVYDVLGNARIDLIQIIAIDEDGNEGAIVKPKVPPGGGGVGLVDISSVGLGGKELLQSGISLFSVIAIFVLLGLSFPMARKLILTIRKAILKKSIIKGG